jgi:phospholipase/carboxylesterase
MQSRSDGEGRLTARVQRVEKQSLTGLRRLGLDGRRDGLLYVPNGYRLDAPAPFALLLHGAGGDAQQGLGLLREFADAAGLVLLAPDARGQTWDVIAGQYGPDVSFLDRALKKTFADYAIRPTQVAIGGFSDGASYALSLGLINGDLFTHLIGFSPGFIAPASLHGAPLLFISHGTADRVLPIDRCSRRLVPQLRRAGYQITYREFDGAHSIPFEIERDAVEWFIHRESSGPEGLA